MDVTYLRNATAIRFATFLAPTIYPTYEYIARSIGEKVGYSTRLSVGQSFEEIVDGQVDVGFLCCLPYVRLVDVERAGLLCRGCNTGLGQFTDDPSRLRAAAEYLERSKP